MPARLSKLGSCRSCEQQDCEVSWHIATRGWYCEACWPRPVGTVSAAGAQVLTGWDAHLDTAAELLSRRDALYGIRVENSEGLGFRVRCPEHGWLGDGLGIAHARRLRDQHFEQHATAEIGLPQ